VDIDDCASLPCLNGGQCLDGVNQYTCNCTDTGYEGTNCEADIDECAVGPCQNNATCRNLVNNYECGCWEGFEGRNCERDVEECASGPCQNNGSCYEKSDQELYSDQVSLSVM
jgi:protein crumbs